MILEIAYGHRVTGPDDELILIADTATTEMTRAGGPGASVLATLVNFLPKIRTLSTCSSFRAMKLMINSQVLSSLVARVRAQGKDD